MPLLFRICRNTYQPQDPAGALRHPGRWHDLGQPVLYFSSSLALAVLEMRANGVSFDSLRTLYHFIALNAEFEALSLEEVPGSFYAGAWTASPGASRMYGSKWFSRTRSIFLSVRSAVLAAESNFILNTSHPDFHRLVFPGPATIPLDPRLR